MNALKCRTLGDTRANPEKRTRYWNARARMLEGVTDEAVSLAVCLICPSGALSYFRCLYVYVMDHLLSGFNVSGDLSQTEFLGKKARAIETQGWLCTLLEALTGAIRMLLLPHAVTLVLCCTSNRNT